MFRFEFAKLLGHLPYFPKQDFIIRKFYNPDPDPSFITFEEQFTALKESHQQGEIRAIGLANETPWGLMKFIECNRADNIKIYVQDGFSILNRSIEISMKEIILRENIIFQCFKNAKSCR